MQLGSFVTYCLYEFIRLKKIRLALLVWAAIKGQATAASKKTTALEGGAENIGSLEKTVVDDQWLLKLVLLERIVY